METKEIRPFPVHRTIVIRSILFALSKIGAELHQYNEQEGIIIATVKRVQIGAIGFGEQEIKASVYEHEQTSLLELTAPDGSELLSLISLYVVQGAKPIKDDAIVQWNDLINKEEARRKQVENKLNRQQVINNLVSKIPFLPAKSKDKEIPLLEASPENTSLSQNDTEIEESENFSQTALAVILVENKSLAIVASQSIELKIPENAGMLVRTRHKEVIEVKVDPTISTDRGRFLQICKHCQYINLQGGKFCANCGQALTLEVAIKHELGKKVLTYANSSLLFGVMGFVPPVIFLILTMLPFFLIGGLATITSFLMTFTKALGFVSKLFNQGLVSTAIPPLLFVVLPSFLFGRKAVSDGQKASQYLNLDFYANKRGRRRTSIGQAIGWFDVYLSISVVVVLFLVKFLNTSGA